MLFYSRKESSNEDYTENIRKKKKNTIHVRLV